MAETLNNAVIRQGWHSHARIERSPNYNARPAGASIELIVVHNISLPPDVFGGDFIVDFFCNRLDLSRDPYFKTIGDLKVSAHFLIKRCGAIVQFVNCNDRAWHAGKSEWCGRDNCNDFSVGVEVEGSDTTAFTADQYEALASLVCALRRAYPSIAADAMVGHSDIAPGRKTDPGPYFDWQRLARLLTPA